MDELQEDVICCVQVGDLEVEVRRTTYPEGDDGDPEMEVFHLSLPQGPLSMEALPDLLRTIAQALRIVRKNAPYIVSRVVEEKLFEALEGPP